MKELKEEDLIFVDESGIAGKMHRTHGWSSLGTRIMGYMTGKRAKRTNIIGAWRRDLGLYATKTYEDMTINRERFMDWLENCFAPQLSVGKVVIMDNAPWHKGEEIKKIIEETGAKLLYLPPYSPDLNPIEHAWANLKRFIRTLAHTPLTITQKIHSYTKYNKPSVIS
jgi:transposase